MRSSNDMDTDLGDTQPANDRLVQRRGKLQAQMQADRQRSRANLRPAPLSLGETRFGEQPRVG